MIIDSQAQATKRAQEGYTYAQERGFDVAEKAAQNESSGQFTNMGIGLGAMAGVGGAVGGFVGDSINNVMTGTAQMDPSAITGQDGAGFCENCGAALAAGAAFCDECGTPVPVVDETKCSNCGYVFERPGKFCPKCGAKRP